MERFLFLPGCWVLGTAQRSNQIALQVIRGVLLLTVLLMVGCARLTPLSDPELTVASDRWGSTQMVGDVQLTARSVGWKAYPLNHLEPYVTVLYVEVKNGGSAPLRFDPLLAVVVDDEGTLYRPLPPQRLEVLFDPRRAVPSGGGEPPLSTFDTDIGATLGALMAGDVAPATQVRGAIYFQRVSDRAKVLTLSLTVGGQVREFRFRVQ